MKKNIEFLSFAKGSAIFWIVIFHLLLGNVSGFWSKLIYLGGSGVHLFFLLSGFGLSLSKKTDSTLDFYKKRFLKILIPYYTAVLIIYSLNYFLNLYPDNGNSKTYTLLGHIFLYKMFDSSIIESYGGHLWFMSTLIQLYLFFPLIQKAQQYLNGKNFILISFTVSLSYWILISYLNLHDSRVITSVFLNYLWEFSLGMALAKLYKTQEIEIWQIGIKNSLLISMTAFMLMGLITVFLGEFGQSLNDIPSLIGILYFTIFLYHFLQYRTKLIFYFFNFIGSISFEVYLIHVLVISSLNNIFSDIQEKNTHLLVAYLPVILLAALALAYIVRLVNVLISNIKLITFLK